MKSFLIIAACLSVALAQQHSFYFTVSTTNTPVGTGGRYDESGNLPATTHYVIDNGIDAASGVPALTLCRLNTYTFETPQENFEFGFFNNSAGTSGAVTDGVFSTPNAAGYPMKRYIRFTPNPATPATIYYGDHSNVDMGWVINILDDDDAFCSLRSDPVYTTPFPQVASIRRVNPTPGTWPVTGSGSYGVFNVDDNDGTGTYNVCVDESLVFYIAAGASTFHPFSVETGPSGGTLYPGAAASPATTEGVTFDFTPTDAGTAYTVCANHPNMGLPYTVQPDGVAGCGGTEPSSFFTPQIAAGTSVILYASDVAYHNDTRCVFEWSGGSAETSPYPFINNANKAVTCPVPTYIPAGNVTGLLRNPQGFNNATIGTFEIADCPSGTFGLTCTECPGGAATPCSGNGVCDSITGDCSCDDGWSGAECATDDSDGGSGSMLKSSGALAVVLALVSTFFLA